MCIALVIFLVISCIGLECQDSHSLRYFACSLSEEVPGIPRFSIVGYIDDIPIEGYSSENRRLEPQAPWVEKAVDLQYWGKYTDLAEEAERVIRAELLTIGIQLNQTRGLHTIQTVTGCTLLNNVTKGFLQVAYDGEDLLGFKKGKGGVPLYESSHYQWKYQHSAFSQDKAEYLEKECTESLQKLLKNDKERLLRRVPPATKVSRRKSGDRTLLICNSYGFYPREIEVKWVRNGVEMPSEQSPILPNPDGTFQIKTTVELQKGDDNMYSCQVEHISLPEIVTVVYGGGRTHWWVLALVSIAAAAAGIAMAILVWKCGLVEQHVCKGASGRGQAQVEMAVQWAAQQNNGAPGIL
ncbi:major histocompatibility complex class I-related gene protein-like [Ambystoma mexicanum]|uniref:major histocompatibility complex class I-related gene protein-like n=1 Tax=Ambystoma mexicanum TaxID=8296 RepID=UPI0037E98D8B